MRRRELFLFPAILKAESSRPQARFGVQSGDVTAGRGVVWSHVDRPARMWVEWSTTSSFAARNRVRGPAALETTGFTARVELTGLPPGQTIFYRVEFEDLRDSRARSLPVEGRFRTPAPNRNVRLLWSGDMCGQGWGINLEWGGARIFDAMRRREPDFFIHSGDTIYADNPIPGEIPLPDGTRWRNLTTPEKSKVAESLDEFRGNYRYNLMDDNVRRFNAEVSQIWQWDDHETLNNWSPGKDLSSDARYQEKAVPLLAARALRAFQEFAPMRLEAGDGERIYRRVRFGPLVEVFVLDMRSYRAANSWNRQPAPGPETEFLGRQQWEWLGRALAGSTAKWKIIAADMPLGLQVGDGTDAQGRPMWEAVANGDGPALGREVEIASLLALLKRNRVRNVVWLTADVHYTAAHYYDPAKARFTDFDPFWEFVSGPLNAGTFGPAATDDTFGPQVVFAKAPPPGQANLPPSAGYQFFGEVEVEARTGALTVTLRDLTGAALFQKTLYPV
jgi:alkaline phosphatase D